jgi:hypothetical protein
MLYMGDMRIMTILISPTIPLKKKAGGHVIQNTPNSNFTSGMHLFNLAITQWELVYCCRISHKI